jgi:hypothetical protein
MVECAQARPGPSATQPKRPGFRRTVKTCDASVPPVYGLMTLNQTLCLAPWRHQNATSLVQSMKANAVRVRHYSLPLRPRLWLRRKGCIATV